jgi:hypothetical protein
MVSKNPNMSKQGAAGKTKHVTLTTPHKLEIIRTFECGKSCSIVMASYSVGLSTTDASFYAISLKCDSKIYTTF